MRSADAGRKTQDTGRSLHILHPASCVLRQGVAAAFSAFLIVAGAHDAAAFGFSVEPTRAELSIPAGKRRGQTLTVRNAKADEAVHLRVYARDVMYLPEGKIEFPPPGSTDWSCASWLQIVPEEVDVPPSSSRDVRVSVIAPPDAVGGRYAMVFFETGSSYATEGIGVNFRVGALIEAVIRGTEQRAAQLKDVAFEPPSEVQVSVFNDGNVLFRPSGQVKVFDAVGKRVLQAPFNPTSLGVFPRTLRKIPTKLDAPLPPGSYRLRVEVDYGVRTLLVGERPFEIR
jgi:hypothetical protein